LAVSPYFSDNVEWKEPHCVHVMNLKNFLHIKDGEVFRIATLNIFEKHVYSKLE